MDKVVTTKSSPEDNRGKRKASFLSFLGASIPFLIMAVASCIPFAIYFCDAGMTYGDDSFWHTIYTFDLLYGIEQGFSVISPGHLLLGNLGYDVYLFYAPFPHLLTVGLKLLFSWAGATLVGTMKFLAVLSVFVSGIFTYSLALNMTKDKGIALAAGLAYIFFPYRLFDFLYRDAFCEGIALCFIPLLFLGVYRILHDEKWHVAPYLYAALGVSLLVLSHPYTALLACSAAIFMMILDIRRLVKVLKTKVGLISTIIAVALVFGFIAFYFFPMEAALQSGVYRISDAAATWTNVEYLMSSVAKSTQFSGLYNWFWLSSVGNTFGDTNLNWLSALLLFTFGGILAILSLHLFEKKGHDILGVILSAIFVLVPLLFTQREEFELATPFFYITLLYVHFTTSEKKRVDSIRNMALSDAKEPEVYGLLVLLAVLFVFLFVEEAWKIAPAIFLKGQFAFRLWGIFGFLALLFVLYLLRPFAGHKALAESLLVISSLLYLCAQAPIDKRICYENGTGFQEEPTISTVKSATKVGVMNEYMPQVFYDSSYVSDYSNSLYYSIRDQVITTHDYDWGIENYQNPVFLIGSGYFQITSLNSPDATFSCSINSSSALVQIPQFYYDGYEVVFTSSDGSVNKGTISDVDGLVAFTAPQGTYTCTIRYIGSVSYRIAVPFFYVTVVAAIAFGSFGYFYRKKKEKKSDLSLKSQEN